MRGITAEQLELRLLLSADTSAVTSPFLLTSVENSPPTGFAAIPEVTVNAGDDSRTIDLGRYFSDPDVEGSGDALTYTVQSNSSPHLVTPVIVEGDLTLSFLESEAGSATLRLRATDTFGEFAELALQVNVKADGSIVSARLESHRNATPVGTVRNAPAAEATLTEWESANVEIWYTVGSDTPATPFGFTVLLDSSASLYEDPLVQDSLASALNLATTTSGDVRATTITFAGLDLSEYEPGQTVLVGVIHFASNESNGIGLPMNGIGVYPSVQKGSGFELRAAQFSEEQPIVSEPIVAGQIAVVTYDVNDDGKVGLADFTAFVENFGSSSDPELSSTFKATAFNFDYDRDGKVGLSDFTWFVQHFGMAKDRQSNIEMPGLTMPEATPPGTKVAPVLSIPVADVVDHAYDATRDILYITTAEGDLQRWSYQKQALLEPFEAVASSPSGLDISADGKFAYLGEKATADGQGTIWKVNLVDGSKSRITYDLEFQEGGVYDLAITSNGRLFFTTEFAGSGSIPLRSIDLVTEEIVKLQNVTRNTGITRGEDRSVLLFQESNSAAGPLFTYDAETDSFSETRETGRFVGDIPAAVSPKGEYVVFDNTILSLNLATEQIGPSNLVGLTFGDEGKVFFGIDAATDEVLVFDAANYTLLRRIAIGADVTSSTEVSITDHSDYLYITTSTGILQVATFPANGRAHDTQAAQGELAALGVTSPDGSLVGIAIEFDEPVLGVTADDFALTYEDSGNLLSGDERVVSIDNGRTWIVVLDPQLTTNAGTYWISLVAEASGISDLSGNLLGNSVAKTWHKNTSSDGGIRLPFEDAVDQVFDATSGILYFTTSEGSLQRWDTQSQQLLPSFQHIAVSPRGLDITLDGQFAFVGEGASGATGGIVWKVDLSDGSKVNISFDQESFSERGVFDLAIAADGKLLFTTSFAGSGQSPLREIDLATGEITKLTDVLQGTSITRSADYRRLFFQEGNTSSGSIFTYDADTATVSSSMDTDPNVGSLPDAVSHDGSLIAFLGSVLDASTLSITATGLSNGGGYAFDPERNILYVADIAADAIVAYDPLTLNEITSFAIGTDLTGTVNLSVTGSSGYAFVMTSTGVWEIALSIPEGDVVPPTVEFVDVAPDARAGAVFSLTVQFSEPVIGVTIDDFVLHQTGGSNLLDENVTIQSTDGGRTWVLGNIGRLNASNGHYQVVLVAVDSGIEDLAGNRLLQNASGAWVIDSTAFNNVLLPFQNAIDHQYDATSGILYILTSSGSIERWDVATQTLLGSIQDVATTPSGFDISPDGQFAYVGEGAFGTTGGKIWRIDLTSGIKTAFQYDYDGYGERGVYDLVVASNGKIYFTTAASGSGTTPFRELDPETGIFAKVRDLLKSSSITRGADRSRLFFQERGISSGPMWVFDVETRSFITSANTDRSIGGIADAVSRDGSMVAILGSVLNTSDLSTVSIGIPNAGGYAFDSLRDLLYVVDIVADEVILFDPVSLIRLASVDIQEDVSGVVDISVVESPGFVFVTTASGIRQLAIPNLGQDHISPTAKIVESVPEAIVGPIESLTVQFSEAVTGVSLDDFSLTIGESGNLLNQSVTLQTSDGGKTWVLGNLTGVTRVEGRYQLTLTAAGSDIMDLAGNDLLVGATGTWTIDAMASADVTLPIQNAIEQLFDSNAGILYILTNSGSIQRWNVATQRLLGSFDGIAITPSSFDISLDGQFAYVGEGFAGVTGGAVRKVNLSDGTVTSLIFDADSSERGVFDVAVGSNGKIYVTTNYAGSGTIPFREIDPKTGETTRIRNLLQSSSITHGADRSRLFIQENNASSGPMWVYDINSATFITSANTERYIGSLPDAVSRDGSMVAFLGSVLNTSDLSTISLGIPNAGAYAFDSRQDLLYVVDTATDEVISYDPFTREKLAKVAIGADVSGTVDISVVEDTGYVYVSTPSGVRQLFIANSGEDRLSPTAKIVALTPNVIVGPVDTMTIQFSEAVVGLSRGDLWLTANGSANLLDGTVTLETSDGGITWTLGNLAHLTLADGDYQLTLVAADSGIQDLSGNPLLNDASLTWTIDASAPATVTIHLQNAKDHVFDANRGILYILTEFGSIERWDVATQSLLSSFDDVVVTPHGFDVTPDGRYAYVGEGFSGVTGGAIRKVDLSDGTVTTLLFDAYSTERGVYDVAISADGKAFLTTDYAGSGSTPLRELDLATEQFTKLRNVNQRTSIDRGADYSTLFFQEANSSDGPIFTYDSDTGTLKNSLATNRYVGSQPAAVNRDGSLIAFRETIYHAEDLSPLATGLTHVAGLAFDPNQDILFVVDSDTDEIIAYDPIQLVEIERFPIGENISGSLRLSLDNGADHAYLTTPSGIRQVTITLPEVSQSSELLLEGEPVAEEFSTGTDIYWGIALSSGSPSPSGSDDSGQDDVLFADLTATEKESYLDIPDTHLAWEPRVLDWESADESSSREDQYSNSVDEILVDPEILLLNE